MKHPLLLLLFAAVALPTASGGSITFRLDLVKRNQRTDPVVTDAVFDIYQVTMFNERSDFTSAYFSFPGEFINTANRVFSDTPETPVIFGFTAPDTFLVLPAGGAGTQTAFGVVDDENRLEAFYSLPGTTPVLPLGEHVIATFAVPAYYSMRTAITSASGYASSAATGTVHFRHGLGYLFPEPSAAMLLGIGLAGAASTTRRRSCERPFADRNILPPL